MKTKDKKELHTKTKEELKAMLKAIQAELFETRLNIIQKKAKNLREAFFKRKDIAQIKSVLREKEAEE